MSRTTNPKCPNCNYEFDEEEVWESEYKKSGKVHTGDGDVSELICPNLDCGYAFKTACVHEIKFEHYED
ncbi:MAG: hypothetical protein CMI54_04665 [Parcubacteria group bacterium]|nr:hypothetical protein [Parcubacteria group bacterium]|tara:strand:+ start:4810 stop:5016 length:207 start_codon:yes stop_codon:yes gene_type:complete